MYRFMLVTLLMPCFLTLLAPLFAAPAGVGFILGNPSGLTAKVFINKEHALDFGLGVLADSFYLYGDGIRHFQSIFPLPALSLYIGAGLGYHDWHQHDNRKAPSTTEREDRFEVRMPIGFEFLTPQVPLGIFFEIVPALRIIPRVDFDLRAGIGLRYYF